MLYVSWYRCARDRLAHAITDEDFASGVQRQQGCYAAVCGHNLLIDSCLVPLSRVCGTCRALVVANNSPTPKVRGAERRDRRLRRCIAALRRTTATTR